MKRALWICVFLVAGCAGLQVQSAHTPAIPAHSRWVVLPFANNTETPLANERAAFTAAAILQADGQVLTGYLPHASRAQEILGGNWRARYTKALQAGRASGATYGLAGSVNEWGYRAGIDARPVIGLTMWVVALRTGKVIWSGVGSASGGNFFTGGTGTLSQRLIRHLIGRVLGQ